MNRKLNYKSLHNQIDKKILKANIDSRPRKTLSFYRYINIDANQELRDQMYVDFFKQEVLGRIYITKEGINAQISVLSDKYKDFLELIKKYNFLKEIPIKIALEENNISFFKLVIKLRKKIVADGITKNKINFSNVGTHLNAEQFNQALNNLESVVVDVRNHYESEVGHFQKAITVDSDTFREQLPMIKSELKGKEEKPILLYCTGGIRCEKASAYLKHYGFKNVGQLYGGIIQYTEEVKKNKLDNKFKGKNFVFDNRLGERVTEEVIAKCHQCGVPCDDHTNCENDDCHLLFIQCHSCCEKWGGCCCGDCLKIKQLPIEQQRELRKKKQAVEGKEALKVYKSRLRPKLKLTNSK